MSTQNRGDGPRGRPSGDAFVGQGTVGHDDQSASATAVASGPIGRRRGGGWVDAPPTPDNAYLPPRLRAQQAQQAQQATQLHLHRPQGDRSNGVAVLEMMRNALQIAAQRPGCADLVLGLGQSPRHTAQFMNAFQLTTTIADLGVDVMGALFYDLRLLVVNARYLTHRPYFTGTVVSAQGTQHERFIENVTLGALFAFWLTEPRRMDVATMPVRWWQGDRLQADIWRSCVGACFQLWLPLDLLDARMRAATEPPHGIGARAMAEQLAHAYNLSPQFVWERYRAILTARAEWRHAAEQDATLRASWPESLDAYLARAINTLWTGPQLIHAMQTWSAATRKEAFVTMTLGDTAPLPPV